MTHAVNEAPIQRGTALFEPLVQFFLGDFTTSWNALEAEQAGVAAAPKAFGDLSNAFNGTTYWAAALVHPEEANLAGCLENLGGAAESVQQAIAAWRQAALAGDPADQGLAQAADEFQNCLEEGRRWLQVKAPAVDPRLLVSECDRMAGAMGAGSSLTPSLQALRAAALKPTESLTYICDVVGECAYFLCAFTDAVEMVRDERPDTAVAWLGEVNDDKGIVTAVSSLLAQVKASSPSVYNAEWITTRQQWLDQTHTLFATRRDQIAYPTGAEGARERVRIHTPRRPGSPEIPKSPIVLPDRLVVGPASAAEHSSAEEEDRLLPESFAAEPEEAVEANRARAFAHKVISGFRWVGRFLTARIGRIRDLPGPWHRDPKDMPTRRSDGRDIVPEEDVWL